METIKEFVEREELERKESELRDRISTIKSILMIFSRGLGRHSNCADPITRATLLFDKLCLCIDIITVAILSGNYDVPDDLKNEIMTVSSNLNTELNYIFNYISDEEQIPEDYFNNRDQPIYSSRSSKSFCKSFDEEKHKIELQKRITLIKSIVTIFSRGLSRQIHYGDPYTRSTLIFDKLYICIDMIDAAIININYDLPDDLKKEINSTSIKLSAELDYVLNHILNPQYVVEKSKN